MESEKKYEFPDGMKGSPVMSAIYDAFVSYDPMNPKSPDWIREIKLDEKGKEDETD